MRRSRSRITGNPALPEVLHRARTLSLDPGRYRAFGARLLTHWHQQVDRDANGLHGQSQSIDKHPEDQGSRGVRQAAMG